MNNAAPSSHEGFFSISSAFLLASCFPLLLWHSSTLSPSLTLFNSSSHLKHSHPFHFISCLPSKKNQKKTSSLPRAAARCPAGSPSLFLPYYWLHQPIPFYLLMFALTLRTLFSLSCCSLINAAAPVVSDSHKGVKGETTLTSLPSARPRTFLMKEAWDKRRPWLIRQCLFIRLFVCLFESGYVATVCSIGVSVRTVRARQMWVLQKHYSLTPPLYDC